VLDYIGSFHLKETDGKFKGWFFPPLGTPGGIVDFKKVFDIMDARGFDGIYTLEIEGTTKDEDKNLTLEIAKKRIENSIAHLTKLGVL
jgi:sugar phosphate isomerase/epimerase